MAEKIVSVEDGDGWQYAVVEDPESNHAFAFGARFIVDGEFNPIFTHRGNDVVQVERAIIERLECLAKALDDWRQFRGHVSGNATLVCSECWEQAAGSHEVIPWKRRVTETLSCSRCSNDMNGTAYVLVLAPLSR